MSDERVSCATDPYGLSLNFDPNSYDLASLFDANEWQSMTELAYNAPWGETQILTASHFGHPLDVYEGDGGFISPDPNHPSPHQARGTDNGPPSAYADSTTRQRRPDSSVSPLPTPSPQTDLQGQSATLLDLHSRLLAPVEYWTAQTPPTIDPATLSNAASSLSLPPQSMQSVANPPSQFALSTAAYQDMPSSQPHDVGGVTVDRSLLQTPNRQTASAGNAASWFDTPNNVNPTNHFEPSNVRGSIDPPSGALFTDPGPLDTPYDSVGLDNGASLNGEPAAYNTVTPFPDMDDTNGVQHHLSNLDLSQREASGWENPAVDEKTTTAYAMLKFNDSYCYVTSLNLVIVRDDKFLQDWKAEEKERKRRARAQEALDQYKKEPSQPSQPGDDDQPNPSSRSGESLDGRPVPGPLSNYSEQGGAVAYTAPSDEGEDVSFSRRRRRSSRANQYSSSTNSIAPHNLHPAEGTEHLHTDRHYTRDGHLSDPREWAQLPVHTARPEDIKKISKEHLIFSYNSDLARWELKVIGNRAFINGELHDRGAVVGLNHDDEIYIATVGMRFMLPDYVANGEAADGEDIMESVEDSSPISTSPIRRSSNAVDVDSDDEDDGNDVDDEGVARRNPRIKLSLKKSHPTPAGALSSSDSPEAAKKSGKGKTVTDASGRKEESATSPPAVPPNLDPNSTLAGLAPDELPEKRKGPGRPPKNGLVSKRDESILRRKQKDLEKLGLPIPEYKVLLEQVRQENKMKDMANKAQSRGDPIPEMPTPSIETDRTAHTNRNGPQASSDPGVGGSGSPPGTGRKSSPKPRRVVKSPSPVKPESECTEEELRKPTQTYIYLLDEVLQNLEGGQGDLQTIYDKVQKRWPWFKYKAPTNGWQSSVRHNLLSCKRFRDIGKSGKGKYWAINYDFELDKSKKRGSPPPRASASTAGPPGLHSSNVPNGVAATNAGPPPRGTYYSPYAQPQPGAPPNYRAHGQVGAPGVSPTAPNLNGQYTANNIQSEYPPQNGLNLQHPPAQAQLPPQQQHAVQVSKQMHQAVQQQQQQQQQQHHQQQQQQPQQPQQPTPFQPVVDAIMDYRTKYLGRWPPNSPEYLRDEETFKRGTQYFSNLFHGQGGDDIHPDEINKEPFSSIREIFERYKNLFASQAPAPASGSANHPANANANGNTRSPATLLQAASDLNRGINGQSPLAPQASSAGIKRRSDELDQNENGDDAKRLKQS